MKPFRFSVWRFLIWTFLFDVNNKEICNYFLVCSRSQMIKMQCLMICLLHIDPSILPPTETSISFNSFPMAFRFSGEFNPIICSVDCIQTAMFACASHQLNILVQNKEKSSPTKADAFWCVYFFAMQITTKLLLNDYSDTLRGQRRRNKCQCIWPP